MNRREFLKGAIRGLAVAIVPVRELLGFQEGGVVPAFTLQSQIAKEWQYNPPTRTATNHWNLKPSDKDTYKILWP